MLPFVPDAAPSPSSVPARRLLVLSASFGDGHNSAARGLATALREQAGPDSRVEVRDFVRESQPVISRMLEKAYATTITHAPWAWRRFYRRAGRLELSRDPVRGLDPVRSVMARDLRDDPPAAVVCTFPLYPPLLTRLLGRGNVPVHSVVTDSISIHPIWRCEGVRTYFAADESSAEILRAWITPGVHVVDSGFPVSPAFARLPTQPPNDRLRSALYFPAGDRRSFARALRSLRLHGPPGMSLTIVLGRHAARLGPVAREILAETSGAPVTLLGWTSDVPNLMSTHDLVIAKAGGATTHETAAAGRPSLIFKVVPGQEEGNVELVQRRGSGLLEEDPDALGPLLSRLVSSGRWTYLRDAAWRHRRPNGATVVARHILAGLAPAGSPKIIPTERS